MSDHSLRSLDALHLAIAQSAGVKILATADRAMAHTAEALGIRPVTFGVILPSEGAARATKAADLEPNLIARLEPLNLAHAAEQHELARL
jgi:hypothetical protein